MESSTQAHGIENENLSSATRTEAKKEDLQNPDKIESNEFTYLQPVIHETKILHQTEEITKLVERERHIHSVHLHIIPIERQRKVVTRVRVTIETEVLPEELEGINQHDHIPQTSTSLPAGRYQPYAQAVHNRALIHVSDSLAITLRNLNTSLINDPPNTNESQVQNMEGTRRSLAVLNGQF